MAENSALRVGPGELVYIEKVRQAVRRLGSPGPEPEDVAQAVQGVRDRSNFDVEVPTASRRRELEVVKTGVKRLSVWYMRYLAGQLNAFANSVAHMGEALAARTEKLEAKAEDMTARISAAEERLSRLEQVAAAPEVARLPGAPGGALSAPGAARPVPVSPAAKPVRANAKGGGGKGPAPAGPSKPPARGGQTRSGANHRKGRGQ